MAIKGLPGFQWIYKGHKDPLTGETAKTRYAINQLLGDRLNVRQVATKQHEGIPYEKFIKKHNIEPQQYKPRGITTGGFPAKITKPRGPIAGVAMRIPNRMKRPKYPLTPEQKKNRKKYVKRYNRAYNNWLKQYDIENGTSYYADRRVDIPDEVRNQFLKDYETIKHPSKHTQEEFDEAWDWISDYEDVEDYDNEDWGDTP